MHNINNKLEDQFRNMMENFDDIPPENVWDKLSVQLDNNRSWWDIFRYKIFTFSTVGILVIGVFYWLSTSQVFLNDKAPISAVSIEQSKQVSDSRINVQAQSSANSLVTDGSENTKTLATNTQVANSSTITINTATRADIGLDSRSIDSKYKALNTVSPANASPEIWLQRGTAFSSSSPLASAQTDGSTVSNVSTFGGSQDRTNNATNEGKSYESSTIDTQNTKQQIQNQDSVNGKLSLVSEAEEKTDFSTELLVSIQIPLVHTPLNSRVKSLNKKSRKPRTLRMAFGYNKNFPLDLKNNHNVWIKYKKVTKKKMWYGIRGDFQVWDYNQNDPTTFASTFDITPNSEFALEDFEMEHDEVRTGVKTLSTLTSSIVNFSMHPMIGYELKLNNWKIDIGGGPGITYSQYRTLPAGINVTSRDARFDGESGTLLLGAYKRGVDFSMAANLQVMYSLSEKFDIGLDAMYLSQSSTILTHGLFLNVNF